MPYLLLCFCCVRCISCMCVWVSDNARFSTLPCAPQFCIFHARILITHSKNAYHDNLCSFCFPIPGHFLLSHTHTRAHAHMHYANICICLSARYMQFPCMFNMINFCNNSIGITRQQQLFHHALHAQWQFNARVATTLSTSYMCVGALH